MVKRSRASAVRSSPTPALCQVRLPPIQGRSRRSSRTGCCSGPPHLAPSRGTTRRTGHPPPPVPGPLVTGQFCAQDESARNAGGTPGCGTADGAARRTRGTQTGSPPVPAGPGCRHPACGAPAEREASAALALPTRTRNACTCVRTLRTGSLAPRPALCRAAAARAAGCPMRSYIHGRTAVSPVGTTRWPGGAAQNIHVRHWRDDPWPARGALRAPEVPAQVRTTRGPGSARSRYRRDAAHGDLAVPQRSRLPRPMLKTRLALSK